MTGVAVAEISIENSSWHEPAAFDVTENVSLQFVVLLWCITQHTALHVSQRI